MTLPALLFLLLLPFTARAAHDPGRLYAALQNEGEPRRLEALLEEAIRHPDPALKPRILRLLSHLDPRVRWHARAALRAQGAAALPDIIDTLAGPAAALSKALLIEAVFDDPAFRREEAVPALAALLEDSLLGAPAALALGGMGLPGAVAELEALARRAGPGPLRDLALEGLRRSDLAGAAAHLRLFHSGDPLLGLEALRSAERAWLPGFADAAERLKSGPAAAFAKDHLGSFYFAELFQLLIEALPPAWQGEARTWARWTRNWGRPSESRLLLVAHLALMGLSFFMGAMLLLGQLKPFEPYRFTLHCLLLLLLGLGGDVWLFIDSPWMLRLAASARLTLLVGLFRARRDLDPAKAESFWAATAGWLAFLVLPAFFYFAGEPWSEALRRTGARKEFVLAALALLAPVALLLADLRLKGGPRLLTSLRSQALAGELLLGAFALLLAACPARAMHEAAASREHGLALLHFLILLPLVMLGLGQLLLLAREREGAVLWRQSPSPRLKAYQGGDLLTVRLRLDRLGGGLWSGVHGILMAALPIGMLAEAAAAGTKAGEGARPYVWFAGISFLGYLVCWNAFSMLVGRELIQIRKGRARRAFTLFGAALKGGLWKKQVPVRAGGAPLDPQERAWLRDCLRRSKGHAPLARPGQGAERPLAVSVLSASAPASGSYSAALTLRLANSGGEALSLQDLEDELSDEIFSASASGQPLQLYFSGADRERVIPAGGALELQARLAAPFPLLPGAPFILRSRVMGSLDGKDALEAAP